MTQEALKLALEAMESDYTFEWPAMHRPKKAEKKRFEAITAIKAALAQPVEWKPEDHYQDGWCDALQSVQKAQQKQPAPQPEQEPELLKVLKMALRQNEVNMVMTGEECRQCHAAIAKATGVNKEKA